MEKQLVKTFLFLVSLFACLSNDLAAGDFKPFFETSAPFPPGGDRTLSEKVNKGQKNSELGLTIPELVSIALQNNPKTRVAFYHAQKIAALVGQQESAYYPKLGIEGYGSHGRTFKFVNGPDVNYTNIGADLTLSMMLYDFGRTDASVKEAKMALLAANWQTDWTLQKVMVSVLEKAFSVIHAQESLSASMETLKDADHMYSVSRQLNKAGLRSITDVYTGQATLALVKIEAAEQRAKLDIQRAELAVALGYPADDIFPVSPLLDFSLSLPTQLSELICLAKQKRADLMAKRAYAQESFARVQKAKADFLPKISFSGRAGADHYIHDKASPAHYDIRFNVEMPLFCGFETIYKNRYAYAEMEMSEAEVLQMELDIELEVLKYSRQLEAAEEMLVFAKENLEGAELAYNGIIEKYTAGKEGIAEVSNAMRQLATARIRYSDIRTRLLVSAANLAYATGSLAF